MHIRLLIILIVLPILTYAQQENVVPPDSLKTQKIEEIVISSGKMLGSKFMARNRTGSAYFLSPLEIQKLGYTDINRMLKAVPGVNITEEDGYGLRPNISLRGTKGERSEKITLMEDGILAAPAPYCAPAAYYFPNAARMSSVEILKGSSQVQYGPYTTGGAINLVSTPIPKEFSGQLDLSYGINNTMKSHFHAGDKKKYFGYMVEYLRHQSDGFKNFEDNDYAGFKRNDFIAKFRVNNIELAKIKHSLEIKLGYANENSKETYVGLSADDFEQTPFLRYSGSKADDMKTQHQQMVATYVLQLSRKLKITTSVYCNTFSRNWYKLKDIKIGLTKAETRSIGNILLDPITNKDYFDVLKGQKDTKVIYTHYERLKDNPGLIVRANNRNYKSKGIQTKIEQKFSFRKVYFNNEVGLRYHYDEEDRFQWDDIFSMQNGEMELIWAALHGSSSNKITSAKALASYLFSKIVINNLSFTIGLRYENIFLKEKDYTTKDVKRSGHLRIENKNHVSVLIPSFGVHYRIIGGLSIFSGIHKGFSPPGVTKEIKTMDKNGIITIYNQKQKPEESINIESGIRFSYKNLNTEVIGFYNHYSNMLGRDLLATGGTGTLEQFNVGEAIVQGIESLINYQPFPDYSNFRLPIQLSYTYTDTEMLNAFESSAWGRVAEHDEIPYVNKHTFNASLGLSYKRFETNVGVRYNGDMRTEASQGEIADIQKVPEHIIIDASARYTINKYLSVSVKAINITNEVYLVSRHPSGLRPGHPFGIFGGVNIKL